VHRQRGILCLAALGPLLLWGEGTLTGCASNPSSFRIGPTKGQVAGVAAGLAAVAVVTTVVLVEVHKAHHTIRGCVTDGPGGLQLTASSDQKVYDLTGNITNVKAGDIVKVHGAKDKASKSATRHREFRVEKINRDYGPCIAAPAPQAALASR